MTEKITRLLGFTTEFVNRPELNCYGDKNGEKVIKICEKLECDWFLNGPAAKDFMDQAKFDAAGIELHYMDYAYPKYNQRIHPFDHYVSILGLNFNEGSDAPHYIWGWKKTVVEVDSLI